jgi:hypothetical protein
MLTALVLLGCFCPCPCQSGLPDAAPQQPIASADVYAAFLGEVAGLSSGASSPSRPTPKDAIGLTDQEARILDELAAECSSEQLLLNDAVRRLTWETRMRAIGSENIPEGLSRKLKDLDNQRRVMALDHRQRLRTAFGDSRFQTLDAFVRSREKAGSFFPPVDPTLRPVLKRAAPPKK